MGGISGIRHCLHHIIIVVEVSRTSISGDSDAAVAKAQYATVYLNLWANCFLKENQIVFCNQDLSEDSYKHFYQSVHRRST